jgi:RNA polymerase sigma-70 factor (ECF subfamily)
MEASDHSLLARYREGDVEALSALVERYRRQLFGYILGMTGGQVEADEVFQEVWFRAIRNVDKYKDKNFAGWLVRIAHNLIIDRSRRQKPEVSLDADRDKDGFGGLELVAAHPDAAEALVERELGERISTAVAGLPPDQKEVFLMRTQTGMPFKEIAKLQRTSINTALARMHYALGKLRSLLEDDYRQVTGLDGADAEGLHPISGGQ